MKVKGKILGYIELSIKKGKLTIEGHFLNSMTFSQTGSPFGMAFVSLNVKLGLSALSPAAQTS